MGPQEPESETKERPTQPEHDVSKAGTKRVSKSSVLRLLIVFRIINSFFVKSFFQPDEFWQSLEPAHFKAFGYGELTWEWKFGLRSYAFSFLFELVYRAVSLISMILAAIVAYCTSVFTVLVRNLIPNCAIALEMVLEMQKFPQEVRESIEYQGVIYGPKIIMAVLAGVGEWYAIRFAEKVYTSCFEHNTKDKSRNVALVRRNALILSMTNFFNCFFITRTFSNTFETDLTSIALYNWDWSGGNHVASTKFAVSLILGLFLCLQRPTNAFVWLPLGLFLTFNLLRTRRFKTLVRLFYRVVFALTFVTAVNLAVDYYFYGRIVFPALRFVKFNYTSALSEFYGTAPWHFHLLQSVPLIAGYSLPLVILGMYSLKSTTKRSLLSDPLKQVKLVIILQIVIFSAIRHKEFRFVYNLQPFFLVISSIFLMKVLPEAQNGEPELLKWYFWIPPFISVVAAMVLSSFHETGVIEVTKYLHNIPEVHSIGFVMPCHSTPWQSHIHRNNTQDIWSISCEPPLHLLQDPSAREKLPYYMDESDRLYEDASKFIYQNFPPIFRKNLRSPDKEWNYEWPQYLVIFEHLDDLYLNKLLTDSGYRVDARFFNTLSHWDSRRSGDVIVYYKPPWF
ncbi:LAFA_0G09032g1_1 [Lachancea sp. 'fantastica']|nr:LAFA_0G09032g1_1 [Lachancea sp. 'fantastica']